MEEFNGVSFLIGVGMGFVIGIAFVCFKRAWRWAGLPPEASRGLPYNVNPEPEHSFRPATPPKAPPPPPCTCGRRGCSAGSPNSPRG